MRFAVPTVGFPKILLRCVRVRVGCWNNKVVVEQWCDAWWGFVRCRNPSRSMASDDSGPFVSAVPLLRYVVGKKRLKCGSYVDLRNWMIYPGHLAGNGE